MNPMPDARGMLVAAFGASPASAQAPASAAAPDSGGPWWTSPAIWALAALVAVLLFAEV